MDTFQHVSIDVLETAPTISQRWSNDCLLSRKNKVYFHVSWWKILKKHAYWLLESNIVNKVYWGDGNGRDPLTPFDVICIGWKKGFPFSNKSKITNFKYITKWLSPGKLYYFVWFPRLESTLGSDLRASMAEKPKETPGSPGWKLFRNHLSLVRNIVKATEKPHVSSRKPLRRNLEMAVCLYAWMGGVIFPISILLRGRLYWFTSPYEKTSNELVTAS